MQMKPNQDFPLPSMASQEKNQKTCAHGRVLDEVRAEDGSKSGMLICKECHAIFSDPRNNQPWLE